MKSLLEIGQMIGETTERKNAAYGSSFATAPKALALLYPNGVQLSQYADMLLIARIWDKLQRIATDRDAFGESPYNDIAGDGLLGSHLHQSKEFESCPGSASDQDAISPAKAMRDSAPNHTSSKTMPNVDAISAARSLPLHDDSFASTSVQASTSTVYAPAPTATAAASASVDALARALSRNDVGLCACCGALLPASAHLRCAIRTQGIFNLCSAQCYAGLWEAIR
ncbi:hypothetical protein ACFQBQ_07770 [Granulicella cerasi]|uniref:Uncharacterized protein n=1 Tax=Granulicella cerasi TaxID=741063 RepID=A0ABW1ZAM7_9BACT|nr:hypothetical protein [Granulicella cerasi]